MILAAVLAVWLGVAGPLFSPEFKTFNESAGLAAWVQAATSGIAIVAVYVAATIPVRAEAKIRDRERQLQARGLALLLLPEILVLRGEIERYLSSGSIFNPPVDISATLSGKVDQLYILEESGPRLIQAIGMINGAAAQVRHFQASPHAEPGSQIAQGMWQNIVGILKLSLFNVDEAIENLPRYK